MLIILKGTTFSGVAFAFATNTEAKEDIITEWPGAGNQTKQKVSNNPYLDVGNSNDHRYLQYYITTNIRKSLGGDPI